MVASLNVTNLIDTAFILLITFMLVTPQLTHGIKLDLPEADAQALDDDPQKTLEISIARKYEGEEEEMIYLDGKAVTLDDLYERIKSEHAERPDVQVNIRADKAAAYGTFARVAATVERAGVTVFALPLLPEPETGPKKRGR